MAHEPRYAVAGWRKRHHKSYFAPGYVVLLARRNCGMHSDREDTTTTANCGLVHQSKCARNAPPQAAGTWSMQLSIAVSSGSIGGPSGPCGSAADAEGSAP